MINLIVGYVLGVFSAFILLMLLLFHRAPGPTMARRRRADERGPVVEKTGAVEERGVNYQWINIAGERE